MSTWSSVSVNRAAHAAPIAVRKRFDADRNVPIAECFVQQLRILRMRTEAEFPVMHISTVTDMGLNEQLLVRLSDACVCAQAWALVRQGFSSACSLDPRATAQIVMLGGMSGRRHCWPPQSLSLQRFVFLVAACRRYHHQESSRISHGTNPLTIILSGRGLAKSSMLPPDSSERLRALKSDSPP